MSQTLQEELAGKLDEATFGPGIASQEEEKALEVMEAQPTVAGDAMAQDGSIGPAAIVPEQSGGAWLVPAVDEQGRFLTRAETEERFASGSRSGRGSAYGFFEDVEQARTYRQAHMSKEGRMQMRAALAVAKGIPQERVARDKALAERLGVDPLTVHYAYEQAEDMGVAKELEEYEGLQEFASRSQFHAAYVRGDMSQLKAIEDWERQNGRQREQEWKAQQEFLEAGGWGGEVRAPNTSSMKTFKEAVTKSELQAQQSDLAAKWIELFEAGRDEEANAVLQQIEATNMQIVRNAAELGPDESWLRRTKVVPAMLEQAYTSLPLQGKSLAAGAAAAGTVLGVGALTGPGVAGAVPLAGKAFTGAALAASTYGTFYLERNLALADLLTKDDGFGHRLPPDIALEAATLHGAIAAGLETVAEKAFLSAFKKIEKTAGAVRPGVLAPWLRDVAQTLQKDPALRETVRGALSKAGLIAGRAMPYVQRAGKVASAESFTETTQELSNVASEVTAGRLANDRDGTKFNTAWDTPENRTRILDAAAGGFWAGLGFGAAPVITSAVYHGVRARSAAQYAQREQERHAVIEQAWTHQNDPDAMRELLETVAPDTAQEVVVPLDKAVQLQQSGVDVLTPLGIQPEQAQAWAASGQAIRTSVAQLHAVLNQEQFNSVSQIFERHGESAAEGQTADEELARTLRQTLENGERNEAAQAAESWLSPEERTAFSGEVDRIRSEVREAAASSPNLSAQAEAVGGLDRYLDTVMPIMRKQASMEARRTGQKPADVLRSVVVRALQTAERATDRQAEDAVAADIEAEFAEAAQSAPAQAETVEPVQTAQNVAPAEDVAEQPETMLAEMPAEEVAPAETAESPAVQATSTEADEAEAEARARTDAQVAEAQNSRRVTGDDSTLIESQVEEPVAYAVWELGDLVPSHDPLSQFAKREDYPQNVQERQYHADAMEQEKVRRNAAELQPRLLLTDNPDLANGPSVITRQGYVLGGNSRAMSLQMVYATMPEKAEQYRQALLKKAAGFGIAPQAVEKLSQPVLVRVLKADMTTLEMAQASRRYNATKTQELTASDEGVSAAKDVSESTLKLFREAMKDYDTVAEYLQSTTSSKFVEALVKDGVIRETSISRLTDKDSGLLNEQGRSLVKNVLRGLVIDDADIVRNAPEKVLSKIDRIAPVLVAIKARGGDWARAAGVFKSAVRQIVKWLNTGSETDKHTLANVSDAFAHQDLLDKEQNKRSVQAVAMLLATATEREIYARCATMDAEAENTAKRANPMASMLSDSDKPKSPAGAFVRAFFKPVAIVDGEVQRIFNPDKSETDAALMWASENSGPRHSVEAAREQLRKTALARKSSPEEKAAGKARMDALKGRNGTVYAWGGPRERWIFGRAFRYRKDMGDVLWQRVEGEPMDGMGEEAKTRLEQDVALWREQVDKFKLGTLSKRHRVTMLSKTPLVLTLVGANKDTPVATFYSNLRKILEDKHNLPYETLKQVPEALADPVMILRSATMAGDYVVVLDLKDQDNATIIVPISLNFKDGAFEINYFPSVYGRKNTETNVPNNQWFKTQIEKGLLCYQNNKKCRAWSRSSGLQLPRVGLHSRNGKKTVFNEQDLVNLWRGKPTYYQSAPVPENPLVALHNISPEALLNAAQFGGLPVPSIGVTKAETPYSDFGDISLIGPQDMVDPSRNPVFQRDAYTARFPRSEWAPVPSDRLAEAKKELAPFFEKFDEKQRYSDLIRAMEESADPEKAFREFIFSNAGKAMYLASKGETVEPVMKEDDEYDQTGVEDEGIRAVVQSILDEHGGKKPESLTDEQIERLSKSYIEYRHALPFPQNNWAKYFVGGNGMMKQEDANELFNAVADSITNTARKVQRVDDSATYSKLAKMVNSETNTDFRAFAKKMTSDRFDPPTITVAGEKVPLTLENAVKAMKSDTVRNEEATGHFGTGKVRAATAQKLETLEDFDRLRNTIVSPTQAYSEKEDLNFRLQNVGGQVMSYFKNDTVAELEQAEEFYKAMADAATKKGGTPRENFVEALAEHGFTEKYPGLGHADYTIEQGAEIVSLLRNGNATYMEAKPQRAVMLNEFLGAVVPEDASPEVLKVLEDNGIPHVTYEKWNRQDRQTKVNALSRQLAAEQAVTVLFQRAWHGSPYKFDRFTLDHIGEGEGAQVHGWGLYFAQSRETSDKRYRERLLDRNRSDFTITENGKPVSAKAKNILQNNLWRSLYEAVEKGNSNEFKDAVRKYIEDLKKGDTFRNKLIHTLDNAIEMIDNNPKLSITKFLAGVPVEEKSRFESLARGAKSFAKNEGRRATIVDVREMCARQRAPFVKEKEQDILNASELEKLDIESLDVKKNEGQLYEVEIPDNDVLLDENMQGFLQPPAVKKAIEELHKETGDEFISLNATGRTIYGRLIKHFGSPKAASLALKEKGVLGISYNGLQDGRCFVIWDEEAIQIYNTLYQAKLDVHQQELNQTPDAFARGAVTADKDNYFIDLFKRADLSTLFHELSHTYFLSMERYVRDGMADAEMKADYETLCKWLNAAPGETLTVEQHEQLARGWEAYLMEGKAPSAELESVFKRICEWFVAIYRSIKALSVELNDDVRGVFDRMLATQDEIEDAAARFDLVNQTTGELQAMGMEPAQMAYTRRVLDEAKKAAFARLREQRDADRKARLADYRRLAMNELRGERVHQARADMRKTPVDLEAVRTLMGDEAAARLQKKQPGTFRKEDGIDPGQFAMEHGYDSAEAMLADMDSSPTLGKAVQARAEELSKEYDRQFSAEDALFDSQELTEHASLIGRQLSQIAGRPYIQQQAVQRVAMQEMSGRKMSEAMRVGDFRANVRRALRDERRAVAQGRFAEALEANTKARLNLEMARISGDLRTEVDKTARSAKRFAGSKSVPDVPKAYLAGIVRQHQFIGPNFAESLVKKYGAEDFAKWMAQIEADGYTMLVAPEVLTDSTAWRDMTMAQWKDFSDAIRQVIVIERNQRNLLTAKGKKDLEEAVDDLAKSLAAHNKAKVNGRAVPDAVRALRRYHAAHMKVEQVCLMMDGGKPGPMWNLIYRPVTEAGDAQTTELAKVRDYVRDKLFGQHYSKKEFHALGKKEYIASIDRSMTKEERICAALNMGNSVNIERLKTGFGWDNAQLADVLSALTAKDWQFVQAVWDYIETFREPAFKVHEAVTGSRPEAVKAEALQVQTADGQTLQLRGGYYPIRYDPVENTKQFERDQKKADEQLFGGRNYGAAATKHGHLKERADGGMGTPLLLNFTVMADHLYNTVHDITHRKAVLDVAKVLRNGKAREAIETYAGREMYQELMPWLQDVANEAQGPMTQIQKMANWARSSGTIMQMGYKITTIAMVPFGYTQTVAEIGWGYGMRGLWHAIRGLTGGRKRHEAMRDFVYEKSPFMRSRLETFDRDIRDFSKQINAGPVQGWVDRIKNNAFLPMGYLQLWSVDMPSWWAAYEKGLKESRGNEEEAAAYADSIVRRTQSSGQVKDLARVQRGSDLHKLLTMFYSYFNTLYNLGAQHLRALKEDHSPAGIWRAANTALLLWFVPSILSELAAGRGPDDDDEWLKWAAKIWIQVPFQSMVGVRDVAQAAFSAYDYQLSPAQSAPASLAKFMKSIEKAVEKRDPSLWVKPATEAVGYAFKLPLKQPIITVENMWDYCTNPRSEFYLRDLFFVKPKERKNR